jgi:hypothetical protein
LFANFLIGQKNVYTMSIDDAEEHFKHRNYIMAIPIYKNELKKDPLNSKIKFRLGTCLVNTKINRQEAVKYLEDYLKEPKADEDAWIMLGRAYHLCNKLDAANKAFNKFIELKPKRSDEVKYYQQQCKNAQELMEHPTNVTFMNLGKEINSEDPDYYPFVDANETFLAFTSRRKENIGGKKLEIDGYRSSDIYYSKVENSNWTKAQNAGKMINTALDEQVVGLKSDGLEMCVYLDHIDKFGDLYITQRKDFSIDFPKSKAMDPIINEKVETSGCLSEDGQLMFFARRDKVDAKSDLYVCRMLPSGKWSLAQKLPDIINTEYNEDFPYLSNDGVTLYFASEGHNSMGGYDLFKTTWNPETNEYTKPVNLGYPINSTDDDRNICVTPDNRVGYVSSFRPGGFGDLDIYRIRFNDNEQISKIITGKVFLGDSTQARSIYEITMIATNKANKKEYTFVPHSKTGKYVISLPPGNYDVRTTSDGFVTLIEPLTISDIGRTEMIKNKNILLLKK